MVNSPDDLALVSSLQHGDREAFDQAYSRHHARLYSFVLRLCRDRQIAEDIFQDTWLALARHAPHLRDDTNLIAWLFTVATHRFRSHRRWSALDWSRWLSLSFAEDYACDRPGPEQLAIGERDLHDLEVALGRISSSHREVILLTAVEQLPSDAVAQILGVSSDTLRQRLSRARAALRSALHEVSLDGTKSRSP